MEKGHIIGAKNEKEIFNNYFSILTLKIYSQEIEYFFTQECCSSSSEIFSLVAKIENNYDYSIISENDILKINTNNIKSIWGISFTGYNNDDDYISEISLNTGSGVISYPLDYLKLVNGITIPGIKGDDQGGHIIARVFNGPGEQINYVPQTAKLNNGEWKSMEKKWKDALSEGKKVEVDIKINYADNLRPTDFDVTYIIKTSDGKIEKTENLFFLN